MVRLRSPAPLNGGVPEWPKGADCKSVAIRFDGSNPSSPTIEISDCYYGSIAQLGEHLPYKQRVTGSIPVVSTIFGSVAQLVRVPACHAGGRGFEPLLSRQFKLNT